MKEVVLEGEAIERKVEELKVVKVDPEYYRTFYYDELTKEKWVYEHILTQTQLPEVPPQLRLLDKFPWE